MRQQERCYFFLLCELAFWFQAATAQPRISTNQTAAVAPNFRLFGLNPSFIQAGLIIYGVTWPPSMKASQFTPFNNTLMHAMFAPVCAGTLRWPDGTLSNYWNWTGAYVDPNVTPACANPGLVSSTSFPLQPPLYHTCKHSRLPARQLYLWSHFSPP